MKGESCEQCGWWKKICKCGEDTSPKPMFFTPWTYEDLDVYPIHITSKRQLKEECKKRNLIAVRLL